MVNPELRIQNGFVLEKLHPYLVNLYQTRAHKKACISPDESIISDEIWSDNI
jgi:hypothetical protein